MIMPNAMYIYYTLNWMFFQNIYFFLAFNGVSHKTFIPYFINFAYAFYTMQWIDSEMKIWHWSVKTQKNKIKSSAWVKSVSITMCGLDVCVLSEDGRTL